MSAEYDKTNSPTYSDSQLVNFEFRTICDASDSVKFDQTVGYTDNDLTIDLPPEETAANSDLTENRQITAETCHISYNPDCEQTNSAAYNEPAQCVNFEFESTYEHADNENYIEVVPYLHNDWTSVLPTEKMGQCGLEQNIQATTKTISNITYSFNQEIEQIMSNFVSRTRDQLRSQKFEVENLQHRLDHREQDASRAQDALNELENTMAKEVESLKLHCLESDEACARFQMLLEKTVDHVRCKKLKSAAFREWYCYTKMSMRQKQAIENEEQLQTYESRLKVEMVKLEKEIIKLQLEKAQLASTMKTAVMRGLCMLNTETLSVLGPIDTTDLKFIHNLPKEHSDKPKADTSTFRERYMTRSYNCTSPVLKK